MTQFEVLQVKYGERVARKSEVFHGFAEYGEVDGELPMDYNFWVMRAGESVVLLDTGYDIAERDWLGEQPVLSSPQGLALLGIAPTDVSMVIASHFHYDHIGYLHLFPTARIVAAQAEYDHWMPLLAGERLAGEFARRADLEAISVAEREGRLQLVTERTEVVPGITVLPVGGHSPGQLIVLVDGVLRPVLLAADAAHFYEQLDRGWPFFAFSDLEQMRRGLARLGQLGAETGAAVVPGHDGRVRDRYPALDGPGRHVVTRLA